MAKQILRSETAYEVIGEIKDQLDKVEKKVDAMKKER